MSAYPGGLITLNPPTTTGPGGIYNDGGTASGMWRLDQALVKQKQSLWPTKSKTKGIWASGRNSNGELGDGTQTYRSSPVQAGSATNWASFKQGSVATQSDGTLWTWGRGLGGQQGNNSSADKLTPGQVGASTDWAQNLNSVAAGYISRFAIKTTGTMWAWGSNSAGILGLNDTIARSSPVQIGAGTTWSQVISNGFRNTAAIKTDGTLWLWGFAYAGGLAQNDEIDKSSPVQVGGSWLKASPGYRNGAGIKSDNTLWTWGNNIWGVLGLDINNPDRRSSPTQVAGSWIDIAMSNDHCLGIKTGGTLWSWGAAGYGRLGNNNYTTSRSSPGQVGALTTWAQVTCSRSFSGARRSDGTFFTWGRGTIGMIGQNDGVHRSSPTQLGTNTDWALINAHNTYMMGGVRAS